MKNIKPSWIIALTLVAVTWVNFNQEIWKGRNVITSDVAQYYSYLPAVFYEHDISLGFLNDTANAWPIRKYYAPNLSPGGRYVFKMSMGMAITYLPFFGLAHAYSVLTHGNREHGFSEAYHFAVQFSSLFYFLAGLFFLSKLLKLFFPEPVISLTLFCIVFGTNAFYYLTIGSGMSHATNFGLMSAFVYYTVAWHARPDYKKALITGNLGGLLTLIRPVNILIYLFFFLYNTTSLKDIAGKIKILMAHKLSILIMAACGILFFMPQMLYWKYISGNYFFNSYVGERFYFNHPHLADGLFSFRKGWLLYTPLMSLALAGIYFLRNDLKPFQAATSVFLIVYLYAVFSWWCWWYGGSFGQRALIDIYPLLSVPFAAFLWQVATAGALKKRAVYLLIGGLVALNLFQSIQCKYNIIHYDSMTRENYAEVFFTITKKPDREKYLKHPDYNKAMRGEDE